jgi:hypothetical protein
MTFHNGAEYKYFGVPLGLYEGMMRSNSHGTFFWAHIREVFPFEGPKMVGINKPTDNTSIKYKINPELARLDKLDTQEAQLAKEYKKGAISDEEYYSALNSINVKRDKLINKLERDGYFSEEILENFNESCETMEDYEENEISYYSVGDSIISGVIFLNSILKFVLKTAFFIIAGFFGFCMLAFGK